MPRETLAAVRAECDALSAEVARLQAENAQLRFLLDAIRALLRES